MSGTPSKIALAVIAPLLLVCFGAQEASAIKIYERDGWNTGISLGFGRGRFVNADGVNTALQNGAAPQWRVNKMLSPHISLGFEYQGWMLEGDDDPSNDVDEKLRRSIQQWSLAVTWYPGNQENAWNGLYLKAGGGFGLAGTALVEIEDGHQVDPNNREDEWGTGFLFGTGYDFWIIPNATVGAGTTINYYSIGETFVDEAWVWVPLQMNISLFF